MNNDSPIFYNAETVRRVLCWPLVTEAVEAALVAVVAPENRHTTEAGPFHRSPSTVGGYVKQPKRSFTRAGNDSRKELLTMPAFVGNYNLTAGGSGGDASNMPYSSLGCKLVTMFQTNRDLVPPLPSVQAHIVIFNIHTGELEALMAGTDITTWRTVAASLVATKHLYFRRFGPRAEHERKIVAAVIGCGVQGSMHARALCANFKIKQLTLYNRTESKAVLLANRMRAEQDENSETEIIVCSTPRAAVENADVICVATFSPEALIHAADLRDKRSVHINAVGAGAVHFGEVASDIYEESLVYVDCVANAEAELVGLPAPITNELGAVILSGDYPERSAVSIFQSMGMASEDVCVAQAVQNALMSGTK